MPTYDPKKIEAKWQKFWAKNKSFEVTEDAAKKKFYALFEFPYPSGEGLHVGHGRPFTAMDVIARKKRMEGYNVLLPIGFDAFGLPTENYALKTGKPPAEVTQKNIANFKRQLSLYGYSLDWSRVVDTTDPAYYQWTQWQFLQFYKHGLAYKKNIPINWCPKDKIGLANEEVVNGACERCGTPVEKKNKEQWMLAITKYADSLLAGLKDVNYIERARVQQENWIGRSEGAEIKFLVPGQNADHAITVFTTRPDTIFGATFVAISTELAQSWIAMGWKPSAEVAHYIEQTLKEQAAVQDRSEKEKTGIAAGFNVVNPINNEEIPVWITNYVMSGVGTGAIMAVPAHDERDFEFAKKYNLPIRQVVAPYTVIVGEDAPRSDENIFNFDAASAIIKHWEKDLYYVVEFKSDHHGFVGGHVEEGETVEQTVRREVAEESGYTDLREVNQLFEHAYSRGYKTRKSRDELCHDSIFVVTLGSERRAAIVDHETKAGSWKSADEILRDPSFINHHKLYFEYFLKNKPFTDAGQLVNSGGLDGMKSEEAKEKIIAKLQEQGAGKKQINYKLRDWVFSRQRYWGEPIPLVHCESCKNKKQKVLIIHGFEGSGEGNWLPWAKQQLEAQGYEVFVPTMTTPDHPTVESWMETILPIVKQFGEDDVIIGHSLGSKAALHAIEKNNKKIGHVYLVASAIGEQHERDWDLYRRSWKGADVDALKKFWETPLNLEKITKLVPDMHLILSEDDPWITKKTHENLPTEWNFELWKGFKHFQAKQQPELLQLFLQSKNTGWVPLPESELPLELPKVKKYEPTDNAESPLAAVSDWVNTKCPRCGGPATRETDTMPNWAGSSWYFLRYCDPENKKEFASMKNLEYWMGEKGVDWYNGGMEHTVLHLLYSRFWNQFLFDIGMVPTREPYKKRTSHGLILGPDGEKMSKSRGNVINPDDMIQQFGADALRCYIMFMGPFDQSVAWDTNGLVGVRRFLEKVWALQEKIAATQNKNILTKLHQTIKKIADDIEKMAFNTAIAKMMELVNEMTREEVIGKEQYEALLKILSPFAPHIAEEIWNELGNKKSIALEAWPEYDAELAKESTLSIALQINGKVRDEITIDAQTGDDEVKKLALASEKVQKWLEGKEPKKVIYVKGKLVSIVV